MANLEECQAFKGDNLLYIEFLSASIKGEDLLIKGVFAVPVLTFLAMR